MSSEVNSKEISELNLVSNATQNNPTVLSNKLPVLEKSAEEIAEKASGARFIYSQLDEFFRKQKSIHKPNSIISVLSHVNEPDTLPTNTKNKTKIKSSKHNRSKKKLSQEIILIVDAGYHSGIREKNKQQLISNNLPLITSIAAAYEVTLEIVKT